MGFRLLFLVFTDPGHLHPFIAVAQHLEAAGHELAFASPQPALGVALRSAGLQAPALHEVASQPGSRGSLDFGARLANPAWVLRFLKQTLIEPASDQVSHLRDAIREFRPDAIVLDPMCYAACIAAELEHQPWAAISTGFLALVPPGWPAPVVEVFAKLAPAQQRLLAAHGISARFRLADLVSPWLNIVLTSETFVPRSLSGNDYSFHVGPALPHRVRGDEPDFPWERLPADRPIVLVSFGSQLSPPVATFETLLASLGPEEACFVVALKDLVEQPFAQQLPAHVIAVRYVPQLALLARTAVMVNHAGANSVMECLAHGVPMLTIPVTNDQHVIARIAEASGVGITATVDITIEAARTALHAMLPPESPARCHARTIQRTLGDGGLSSAELVVELARNRRAIVPHTP